MDLDTFNWLLTDEGQALVAAAQAGDLSDAGRLGELTRLRRLAAPDRAAAAYEIAWLRRRAAAKFANAAALYFTREALEQASGELIAAYRARRYAGYSTVADLACGVGGDTLGLARVAQAVAVDRDPLRLAMAAANARASGLADRVVFREADLEQAPPPDAEAIFFDPARRSGGRRVFALAEYQPPVAIVRSWRARTPAIGVKVAPGVSDDDLAALEIPDLEVEFISVDGELKEAVLWLGPLAGPGRCATVLRGVGRLESSKVSRFPVERNAVQRGQGSNLQTCQPSSFEMFSLDGSASSASGLVVPPRDYLYEPDPAVIRAGLVTTLAAQIGAAQIDHEIAYLTADRVVATPFARCWPIVEWLPFGLKRIRARLRALDAGAVTVKKRGSPLDTDALARQLSGGGARPLVVVLTRVNDQPAAIICGEPLVDQPTR
jgi:SAM-dependent methyltransferase